MGNSYSSSSSCMSIILCNSTPNQGKSSDKRGWSFRKRSSKNRVLVNNVSSETTAFANEEAPQFSNIEFQPPVKSAIVDEKSQLSKPVEEISKPVVLTENYTEPKPSIKEVTLGNGETYTESKFCQDEIDFTSISNETSDEYKMVDVSVGPENDGDEPSDEFSAANESFFKKSECIELDERKIFEPENSQDDGVSIDESVAIIIQTAMRSFMARKEFMQLKSAVKLQAVIRGNLVRRNAVATLHCLRAIVKVQALVRARSPKSLVMHTSYKNKPDDAQLFTVKLLKNSFTRQLLESTSKPKSLNIKCDPMRPNSAWSWLERWMAVSASEASEKQEPSVEPEIENENEVQKIIKQYDIELSLSESISLSDTTDSNFSENGEKSVENDENHNIGSSSTEVIINEQCHTQKQEIDNNDFAFSTNVDNAVEIFNAKAEPTSLEYIADIPASGEIEQLKPALPTTEPIEINQPKLSAKHSGTSEVKSEGKKFIYGSKKASNPAFIAAQSKFEEMTLAAKSNRAIRSSLEESVKNTNALGDVENSGNSNPQIHGVGYKCGTNLSVSSTLDPPDKSEIKNVEACQEVQFVEKQDYEVNGIWSSCVKEIPSIATLEGEIYETGIVSVDPIASEISLMVDEKLDTKPSNVDVDFIPESLTYKNQENGGKISLEASPISHRTVPESRGTPSSQASVKGKRNVIDKHGSHKKRSSPTNTNAESSGRISTEHLTKNHKSGKRRNSFGSTKSENADQELGDSSSRNSMPSYMQATESARAKANSPRSSPDVSGKEVHSKKRNSLPGTTGTKAHGSHPNERKWLR